MTILCRFPLVLAALVFSIANTLAAELQVLAKDIQGAPIADAVVVAVPHHIKPGIKPGNFVIDQIDKEFLKHILAVPVGATISFPNKDNIRHHVYSFSPAKTFELPLYKGTPSKPETFDKPGTVVLGCNIHDWMLGYVYVVESPFYGQTNTEGRLLLDDLPADDYSVRVWHPNMQEKETATVREVTIANNEHKEMTWELLPIKPEIRIPRAPISNDNSYP